MLLKRKLTPKTFGLGFYILVLYSLIAFPGRATAFNDFHLDFLQDTIPYIKDTLPYPIHDRRGDYLTNDHGTALDLKKPSNIQDSIAYDPSTHHYIVYEKIGSKFYRTPTWYTSEEFMAIQGRRSEVEYFKKRGNTLSILNRGKVKPKLNVYDNLFNRLFGNGKIEIQPQGNVDITAGYQGQNIKNPTLPERARKNGGFDFDMAAQLNVNANIGDKLKFPISYNTLANLDFTNQLKLDYTGLDDEILKRFEAGNISFPSRSTLIPGAQSLFGIKTQLQFGKLFVTTVLANQKSQRQSMNLQGGAASQQLEIKGDDYEENRHFLLGQYFKENYNKAMKSLPVVNTQVQILRMEVWVTNKNGTTTDAREIVGLMDLGEQRPFHPFTVFGTLPGNNTNSEYSDIISKSNSRNPALVTSQLLALGLSPVQDFEKTFARKLDSSQYIYNSKIGFVSLSQPLQPDEVLAVAYQYIYNGRVYQVGEFSQDLPPDTTSGNQKVLFLKLLKATSQRPALPIWQLMMKNVYSVGFGTLERQDFKLDVLYQEPGLGAKRYVPFGNINKGTPLLTLVNLDRLNNQNDPQPDGVFDYVEGFTVIPQYSRVIFPVLEPFGRDLASQVYSPGPPPGARDTLYYALYDSIKAVAQQFPNLDRFILKVTAKTSAATDISIGYNIPPGSVNVTAGGQVLRENIDYTINYDLGTIKVINPAITNAGLPVQVNYENNASFGLQQKNYMALRLDYLARNTTKQQLSFGATMVRLGERPFFTKVDYGEDPIRNTMYGLDMNYRKDAPRLTKWLDKLPFYQTTVPSSINAYVEGAYFQPGHAPQIGKGSNGIVYIDNFEGSKNDIDLRFPPISWALASTPLGATDPNGTILFPEATDNNSLSYGKNRARLAWYQIEPILQDAHNINNPLRTNRTELSDPRVRSVSQTEIFPQRSTDFGQNQLITFDLAYYPTDRGPYNFDASASSVNSGGKLLDPKKRWGGLMRSIDQTDFETGNVEYIECWVQDPFILNPSSKGGKFYINLGNISEDVLKDSRRFYENGLPTPHAPAQVDTSVWGRVPRNPVQVTNAFSNDPNDRPYQDVGFDGLNDSAEIAKRRSDYLDILAANFGVGSKAYQDALQDPSADNYHYYRGDDLDASGAGILGRYKRFNNPQGNSPIAQGNSQFSQAATLYPDQEDLNRDNTLNETEEYFQYTVDLKPPTSAQMQIGQNFIVDKKNVGVKLADGSSRSETWYQMRIPINAYDHKIGNIPDFKSIRFIRMFLTGFEDSVVVRFGKLDLVRNTWRKFQYKIDSSGIYSPATKTDFNVGAVNIEENDKRSPLPYRTPKEIERVQTLSNNGVNLLQNEQALSLRFCDLLKGDAKGVFQTFANRDLRQYRKLQMYIHAEKAPDSYLNNNDLTAVVRIGNDFVSNYYEIRIPLKLTPLEAGLSPNSLGYNDTLWMPDNSLDVNLDLLPQIKTARNLSNVPLNLLYESVQPNGNTYSIIGNPNLGELRGILMGVENTKLESACGEVWFNELRLSSINEQGGYAALARVDANLADLGTVSLSANMHTNGFGTLEQRVNERYKDTYFQFDAATNLELGKFFPKKAAISIPFYGSYSQSVSTPQYDPFDLDIKLKNKLKYSDRTIRDSIRKDAVDFTSIKTLNFTNVRKNKTNGKKPKVYDISNVDLTYNYTKTEIHNPLIEHNEVTKHHGGLGYNFSPQPKYYVPFKKFIKTRSHWLDLVKDFNFNPIPSQLTFKADIFRQFGALKPRSVGESKYEIPETYDKYYTFDRLYILRWDLTHSLNLDYYALNNARIDEPYGRLDTKAKRDTVRKNLFRGGRNVIFNQTANFSYNVPTAKIPLLDWTTLRLRYTANYRWIGASRLAVNLGNFLENGQQEEANLQMDFSKLYNKSKFFRAIYQPAQPTAPPVLNNNKKDTTAGKKGKKPVQPTVKVKKDPNALPEVGGAARFIGRILTSIKTVNATLSENSNTRLPGYMDSTKLLGENFKSMAPGFDFILGRQPDSNWLNRAARKGLITKDTLFNDLFRQTFDQRIALSAQLEPFRDFNIDVNIDKTFNKNYTELFKDTTGTGNNFGHLSPYAGGGFNVSYIAFKTLFQKFDPNQVSETFIKFQDYRKVLSERLGSLNPYSKVQNADGYYKGYGRYAIDVLVPAFIAAYTGQDPTKVSLIRQNNPNVKSNPFRSIMPKPNWRITYNGLSRLKGLDQIFTNFTLTHAYTASLSMNSFTSALLYQDVSRYGYPSFIDTVSNNFIPYYLVPNITIQEQFAPLIGFDVSFVNQVNAKFEYVKQRQLSLSLIDFQLSEVRSTEYTIGAGYRKRGLRLPFKIPFSKNDSKKLDNEINFRFDLKVRDNVTSNSRLDQQSAFATNGSKEITLSPTVDYYISNRVNLKFYFDQRKVIPYISSAAPTTNTRAGMQIRISLAQ
ncbi:MAG: cell surface protein SprA [Ginsengibacter sp.]